jgi:flagellar hook-length control protein FliK
MYKYLRIIVIGIIMPQLNVLPVNLSQSVELKDESSAFISTTSKGEFSQYIDQHLTKNKEGEGVMGVDEIKSAANSTKNANIQIEPQGDRKKVDDSAKNIDITDEAELAGDTSVSVQKIAADGNKLQTEPIKTESSKKDQKALFESEQLMSFLTKADNTLLNQPIDTPSVTSSPEQMLIDQKSNNEAQLLLNASHLVADLSAVAKALEKDQSDVMLTPTVSSKLTEQLVPEEEPILPNGFNIADKASTSDKLAAEVAPVLNKKTVPSEVPVFSNATSEAGKGTINEKRSVGVTPILMKKAVPAADLALNSDITEAVRENTKGNLFVESIQGKVKGSNQTEAPVTLVKGSENKAVLTDLDANSISDVELANANGDKIKLVQSIPNPTLSSQALPSQAVPSKQSLEGELETIDIEAGSSSEEPKITNQLNKQVKLDQAQMHDAQINQPSLSKTGIQTPEQKAVNLSQLAANANEKINPDAVGQANNVQAQADAVKSLGKTNDLMNGQINQSEQTLQEKKLSSAESQLVNSTSVQNSDTAVLNKKSNQAAANINTTALSGNQFSDSDLNADEANKASAKQDDKAQLSAFLSEQNQQKSIANNETMTNDKVTVGAKNGVSFNTNTSFIDVTGKATETAQDVIEQQSIEILNPSVATEVTQNQKTNTQLHQETISLFRKDFADAVKDKVMLMISQKLQRFDITLDPPELGNMQVRVNLQGEQATVNFIVQSQQTKDALEQNMHKLRDSLSEQGVDVGDANVEQQSQQSSDGEETTAGSNNKMEDRIDNMAEANDVVAHTLSAQMIDSSTASVDYYA